MLESKLFVSRFDDPFPDLYERFWDGVEDGSGSITDAPKGNGCGPGRERPC